MYRIIIPLIFPALYFIYFSIITLAIKKDLRKIPYYNKLTDENKKQYNTSCLIHIHFVIYLTFSITLIFSIISFCIFYTFNPNQNMPIIIKVLFGIMIILFVIEISKIPLIMSKKRRTFK